MSEPTLFGMHLARILCVMACSDQETFLTNKNQESNKTWNCNVQTNTLCPPKQRTVTAVIVLQ